MWLFDAATGEAVDTYANDEAHGSAYAHGVGDLAVHWGVEAFTRNGQTIVLDSDRDDGL